MLFAFVGVLRHVLSPATLPNNWGTSMATEYRITSFTLAADVGRGTSVWFVGTTHQKSMPTKTNETGEILSKESQSLDGPKCE